MSLSSVALLLRGCATRSLETDDLHKARYVCLCMYVCTVFHTNESQDDGRACIAKQIEIEKQRPPKKIARPFHISRVAPLYNSKFILTYTVSLISKGLEYPVIKIYYYLCVASFDSIKNISLLK